MKKKLMILILSFLAHGLLTAQTDKYSKEFIKLIIEKVNNYQIAHPWAAKDNNWIRGTYYTGVMAAYQATGEKKYLDQCNDWGKEHNWKLPTAKIGSRYSGTNLMTCSQTWLESYMVEKKNYKIKSTFVNIISDTIKNPVTEPLTFYFESGRRYVDALYVCPPTLAMMSKITKDPKYLNWMDGFFWDVYGNLFDQKENLFYRDDRFVYHEKADTINYNAKARRSYPYRVTPNGKKVLWSRGNGWAFAGLARILKYTPTEYGNYQKYKKLYVKMAEELKKRQQSDGFWYPNLDDSKDYGSKETSGTGFFVYGFAWGINNGILSRDEYLPVVEKGWEALVSSVSNEGKVQWGQLEAASPFVTLQEDTHEYVSGIFLLAASEIYKLPVRK